MDYSTILSNAARLKKNSLYKVTINEATREILYQLNTTIMTAHDGGLARVEFKLPVNFREVDSAVSNQELQTAIYYKIIEELERKDYDVKLTFYQSYTLMKVSWSTKADAHEVDRMRNKIMSLQEKC